MVREVKRRISRLLISTKGKTWLHNLTDIEISHNTRIIPKLKKIPYEIDEFEALRIIKIRYPEVFKKKSKERRKTFKFRCKYQQKKWIEDTK